MQDFFRTLSWTPLVFSVFESLPEGQSAALLSRFRTAPAASRAAVRTTSRLGLSGLQLSESMGFGQLVIGPPGAGKTTYCNGLQQFLSEIGRSDLVCSL